MILKFTKNTISVLLIGSLFTLISCNSLNPTVPVIEKSNETITPVLSSIQLPILFPLADLESLVNSKLPDTLHADQNFAKNRVKLSVIKAGNIHLEMAKNELSYRVPLKVWVEVKTKFGIQSHTDFALELAFKSEIGISPEWQLITNTSYQGMNWLKKPSIKIAFFKIGIAKIVEKLIQDKVPTILPQLDAALAEKLPVKAEVAKVWAGIQKPILVNKKMVNCWMSVKPQQVYLRSLAGVQGQLQLDMVVDAFMDLYPAAVANTNPLIPLPNLSKGKKFTKGFHINALMRLPFSELNKLLKERLINQSFNVDDYEIKLKKALLQGSKNQVVLELKVKGAVKGSLYFKGTPAFDSLNNELTVDEFDFDVNTENMLVGSADWLLHDDFNTKIKEQLHIPIKEFIAQLPALIEQGVAQSKLGEKVKISLSHFDLNPSKIVVNNQEILFLVNAEGNLALKLTGLGDAL